MRKFQSSAGDMCNLREPLGDTMRELFYLLEWGQLFSMETFLGGNCPGEGFPRGQLSRGNHSGDSYPEGKFLRGKLS